MVIGCFSTVTGERVGTRTGREQRGVEEELRGGLGAVVARGLLRLEVQDDRGRRVDLHGLLALHVLLRSVIAHGLRVGIRGDRFVLIGW